MMVLCALRHGLLITILVCLADCRGSRSSAGGGSAASSSRPRLPSRRSSNYISYVPGVRYSRANSHSGAIYGYYHSQYFYLSRTSVYKSRRKNGEKNYKGVCANYEGNGEAAVMGIFSCPLEFEPDNFTYCCGAVYAEYCCEPGKKKKVYVLAAILVSCGTLLLIIVYLTCCKIQESDFKLATWFANKTKNDNKKEKKKAKWSLIEKRKIYSITENVQAGQSK